MSEILVVYYSLTGHTRQVAEQIAAVCGADIDPIVAVKPRRMTFSTYFWGGWEALRGEEETIEPAAKSPKDYDLVVLGSPNWAAHMPPPVRRYLAEHAGEFAHLAVFCTQGGANGEKVLTRMGELAGHTPVASLLVSEPDLETDALKSKVTAFVSHLQGA